MRRLRLLAWSVTVPLAAAALWMAIPLPEDVASPGPLPSTELEDRFGVPLRTLRAPDGRRGGWIDIEDVDPKLIQAFVAIEDHRFFDHPGVDVASVGRALRDNLGARTVVSGASTLTMQSARLLRGMNRSWTGKLAQAMWALRIDAHLSKNDILEIYLNRVPLGQGTVGVAAASELYFGTPPNRLSLGQASLLAGTARLPAATNPHRSRERARARRAQVLARMADLGMVSPGDAARAAAEPTGLARRDAAFLAPHFTTHVIERVDVGLSGKRVRTTLDLDLQRAVEGEVRHAALGLAPKGARHAAAVVLDNRSGDVLAWVGSPDFFADSTGQVDMVTSRRQPGSALKPFLYGLAFDRGYTPATVLPDVPRTYRTATGSYAPRNYDRTFRGPVRVRDALASSYNVPAVELTDRVGTSALLGTLRAAGFNSLDRDATYYGLGLALGNGEVTLLELANAYRGLVAGGVLSSVQTIRDGTPGPNATLPEQNGSRFLTAGSAALVLDILSDPTARIGGFGTNTVLEFPFPVAAKTGTSRHFTDNWAVATTATTTVAVWVGNFDGQPMESVSGITGAGPLLRRIVFETAARYAPGALPSPGDVGARLYRVCTLSGMAAHADCPSRLEWFPDNTGPIGPDTWQTRTGTTLPPEYAEWARGSTRLASVSLGVAESPAVADRPTALADTPTSRARIVSPAGGDVFFVPPAMDPRYATVPLVGVPDGAVWSIDGRPHREARWRIEEGPHWIVAEWPSGVRDSVRVEVR